MSAAAYTEGLWQKHSSHLRQQKAKPPKKVLPSLQSPRQSPPQAPLCCRHPVGLVLLPRPVELCPQSVQTPLPASPSQLVGLLRHVCCFVFIVFYNFLYMLWNQHTLWFYYTLDSIAWTTRCMVLNAPDTYIHAICPGEHTVGAICVIM